MPEKKWPTKSFILKDELYKKIKIANIKKNISASELIRRAWEEYLKGNIDIIGYKNYINENINTTDMNSSMSVVFPDINFKKEVEKKLYENEARYQEKQFYNFSYVTAEIVEKYLKGDFHES